MKSKRLLLVVVVVLIGVPGTGHAEALTSLPVDFYVGWQGGHRETLVTTSDGPYPGALYRYARIEVPNEGVWLGAGTTLAFRPRLTVRVEGWWMLPNNKQGGIALDPGATPIILNGDLSPNLDWWYLDLAGIYNVSGPFSIIQGWRFDHHALFTENWTLPIFGTYPIRFDVNVLSTIPFFGAQWSTGDSFTLRALYTPWAWVNMKSSLAQNGPAPRPPSLIEGQRDLSVAQFAELFFDYSRIAWPAARVGVVARLTWMHGSTQATLTETLVNGAASYDVAYDRIGLTIGANGSFAFNTPGFL